MSKSKGHTQLSGNKNAFSDAELRPHLHFSGRCEEALEFYQQILDAKVDMIMRFSQSPVPLPENTVPPDWDNKILHASFSIGKMQLSASDDCIDSAPSIYDGFRLILTVSTETAFKQAFDGLAEEGTVVMPPGKTFWTPHYGEVIDKFGIGWKLLTSTKE